MGFTAPSKCHHQARLCHILPLRHLCKPKTQGLPNKMPFKRRYFGVLFEIFPTHRKVTFKGVSTKTPSSPLETDLFPPRVIKELSSNFLRHSLISLAFSRRLFLYCFNRMTYMLTGYRNAVQPHRRKPHWEEPPEEEYLIEYQMIGSFMHLSTGKMALG